jgi:hypothetical protein
LDSLLIGLGLTAVTILSISGTFAAQIAMARRRSPVLWFVYGVALGPLGTLLVWLSPPSVCPVCGTPTRGWLRVCDGCGRNTRSVSGRGLLSTIAPVRSRAATSTHPAMLPTYRDGPVPRRAVAAARAESAQPEEPPEAAGDVPQDAPAELPAAKPIAAPPAARLGPTPGTHVYTRPEPRHPGGGSERAAASSAGTAPAAAGEPRSVPAPLPAVVSGRPAFAGSDTATAAPVAVATADPVVSLPAVATAGTDGTRTGERRAPTSLLATGVFTGGTAGLVVGARYAIVRAGTEFHVLGPLDSAPDSIVLRRPLDELDPLCVNDRCIISHRSQPTRALIAMRGIAGLTGENLEAGLRPTNRIAGEAVS